MGATLWASFKNVALTEWRRRRGASNFNRWANLASHDRNWEERTRVIASYLQKESTVLEFGAGRQILRQRLPSTTTYFPSDITARSPDTIVCDLNRAPLPDFPAVDCAVFSGVLEYVNDVPGLLNHLRPFAAKIVCSYVYRTQSGIRAKWQRRRMQWVNDFSQTELAEMFRVAGYRLTAVHPFETHQSIFEFERE